MTMDTQVLWSLQLDKEGRWELTGYALETQSRALPDFVTH